jgi:hypothetical protein
MKQLHEYQTPETNRNQYASEVMGREDVVLANVCAALEQRLAACRDALKEIQIRSYNQHLADLARETLTLTAPK